MSRALYERLCDIKERCEQLVEDLHGNPASAANDRVLAKAVLYDLHVARWCVGKHDTMPQEGSRPSPPRNPGHSHLRIGARSLITAGSHKVHFAEDGHKRDQSGVGRILRGQCSVRQLDGGPDPKVV